MRLIGFLVAACLALAVLQVAIQAAVVVGAILLLLALITQPQETVGLIVFFVALHLVLHHPLIAIPGLIALMIVGSRAP
jgi:hypothetical protein